MEYKEYDEYQHFAIKDGLYTKEHWYGIQDMAKRLADVGWNVDLRVDHQSNRYQLSAVRKVKEC